VRSMCDTSVHTWPLMTIPRHDRRLQDCTACRSCPPVARPATRRGARGRWPYALPVDVAHFAQPDAPTSSRESDLQRHALKTGWSLAVAILSIPAALGMGLLAGLGPTEHPGRGRPLARLAAQLGACCCARVQVEARLGGQGRQSSIGR
jgi:hypothetical protein